MLKLIGADGSRYYAWNIEPGSYVIGRNTGNNTQSDLAINDRTVSRKHARIEVEQNNSECYLEDIGSHNGTFVNGTRISDRVRVKAGDHIQFGQAEFKLADESAGEQTQIKRTAVALSDTIPDKSVVLSVDEALRPLPATFGDRPQLLSTLFDMAKILVLSDPQEVMLERSLELVAKVIPADRLAVLFTEDNEKDIYPAATLLPGGKDPGSFELSQTIVDKILSDKNSILIADAADDPRFAQQQSIIMSEMKSAMAVPLFDEGKVLGILYADTTNPMHRYTDEFLRLFATFGNIIGSRLINYALLEERQAKRVYEAESQRASKIQKYLLPAYIPKIDGYSIEAFQEQCLAVGGDLYDVHKLKDDRLLFLVADVSGKGMGAALLMSNILAAFRILYDLKELDLVGMVEQVSLKLYQHSTPELFATLFVGILDPRTHKLTFINAGHNPPLVVRANGGLEHLNPSGTMIGAFDISTWSEESTDLNPGDLIIVFTDGVTEAGAGPDDEEEYSDERFEKFLVTHHGETPADLIRNIMVDVDDFTGDADRSDDITMVALKRNA